MFRGILPCISLVLLQMGWGHCYTMTTSGKGGVPCGDHVCLSTASCTVNNTCVCDTAPLDGGNGYLKCYPSSYMGAFIVSDPWLTTYGGEHAHIPLPCRYDFTELSSNFLGDDLAPAGVCSVHVRAFNRKDIGKFYVHGFDTAIRVTFFNGTIFKMSVRKFGTAENGIYNYQVNATEGVYHVDGPFEDDDIAFYDPGTGLSIVECQFDEENNIAIINITNCGICIYFRAYDVILRRNQVQIPGLGVGINQLYNPFVHSSGGSLALSPTILTKTTMADLPLQISNTADIVYRALVSGVPQNNPGATGECFNLASIVFSLSIADAKQAFKACLWMVQYPKFIRCHDPTSKNGLTILPIFLKCIGIFNSLYPCSVSKTNAEVCLAQDPDNTMLQQFATGIYCP